MKCSDDSFYATTRTAHDKASPCASMLPIAQLNWLNSDWCTQVLQEGRQEGLFVDLDVHGLRQGMRTQMPIHC